MAVLKPRSFAIVVSAVLKSPPGAGGPPVTPVVSRPPHTASSRNDPSRCTLVRPRMSGTRSIPSGRTQPEISSFSTPESLMGPALCGSSKSLSFASDSRRFSPKIR